MRKPDDIPQDVWDAAEAHRQLWAKGPGSIKGAVARAIMAAKAEEREAILTLVSEYVWDDHALAQATDIGRAVHHQSVEIAAAIRKRGEG